MALKSVVDSLDGIDEKYHALYAEKDGKFHLDAEVAPPANDDSKLGEFRENNRKLFEQNQTLEGRVKFPTDGNSKAGLQKTQHLDL